VTFVTTLAITLGVTRLTGFAIGLGEPLFNRSLAGFLAAVVTLWPRKTGTAETISLRTLRMLAIGLLGVAIVLSLVILAVPLMNRSARGGAPTNPSQPRPSSPREACRSFPAPRASALTRRPDAAAKSSRSPRWPMTVREHFGRP